MKKRQGGREGKREDRRRKGRMEFLCLSSLMAIILCLDIISPVGRNGRPPPPKTTITSQEREIWTQ